MFDIDRYAPKKKNRSIFRLLKFYWKRYLRWNRLNNEKREMKQYKKEKYIPKLPKLNNNATIILVVLICAFSYIYVEHSKIVYQEKIRNEKELEETNQRSQLEDCLSDAETNYNFNWNKQCKSLGKKNDCTLPAYRANSVEKWRTEAEQQCMEKFKNKAFDNPKDFDWSKYEYEEVK